MDDFSVCKRCKSLPIILLILSIIFQVQGEPGILKTRYASGTQSKEYCIGYSHYDSPLPLTVNDKDFKPLLDLTPSDLCTPPADTGPLKHKLVEVLRGNCTFVVKGFVAQNAGANATIVITDSEVIAPSLNASYGVKIPVVLLSAKDHNDIRSRSDLVEAVLYNPEVPGIDINLLVIWIMAMGTVAIGGYWCGVTAHRQARIKRKRDRRSTSVHDNGVQKVPSGSESSEEEDDNVEEEDESVTITPVIVVVWVCMIFAMLLLLFFFYDYVVYIVIGMYCLGAANGMHQILTSLAKKFIPWKQRIPANRIPILSSRPTILSVILYVCCVALVVCWFIYRHEDWAWILLDMLGICFCISVLRLIRLQNFKTCFLLLSLLFVYDIFMVFVTPLITRNGKSVMVEVATGGEGATEQIPVLLMVPRLSHSAYSVCNMFSMLGFGDILVPGLLVGYCHTFDLTVQSNKIYYFSSCIAYGVGLVITFIALAMMKMGQPALLYLVPCTVLTVLMIAAIRRELAHFWHGRLKSDRHVL